MAGLGSRPARWSPRLFAGPLGRDQRRGRYAVEQRDGDPANGAAQEGARYGVAEEMEVGSDQGRHNRQRGQDIEHAEARIADPQHREHGERRRGVPGRERAELAAAVKPMEGVILVAYPRRVVVAPRLGPRPSEHPFDAALDRLAPDPADPTGDEHSP